MNTQTKKSTISAAIAQGVLTISCEGFKDIVANPLNMPNDICEQATLHGLKQKIVDAAAIGRNPDTGRSASVAEKYAAMLEVFERLCGGDWNKGRADGTTGSGGLLFRALVILYPAKSADDLRTYLEGKTKTEQAALRKNPKVAAIIDTLRDDDDAANGETDTDAMLDELAGE